MFLSLLFHKQPITSSFSTLAILGNTSVQLFLQLDTDLINLRSRYSWANWLILLYHLAFTVRSRFDSKLSFAVVATEGKHHLYLILFFHFEVFENFVKFIFHNYYYCSRFIFFPFCVRLLCCVLCVDKSGSKVQVFIKKQVHF